MKDSQKSGRLTAITLENFRGIGKAVTIDLKPLTLLFGPNSAGKSTVLKALRVMKTLMGHEPAAESIDRILHKGDTNRKTRIRIEMKMDEFEFRTPETYAPSTAELHIEDLADIKKVWVEVILEAAIISHQAGDAPVFSPHTKVSEFAVGINGTEAVRTKISGLQDFIETGRPSSIWGVPVYPNYKHPLFITLAEKLPEDLLAQTLWELRYLNDSASFSTMTTDDGMMLSFEGIVSNSIPAYAKYPHVSPIDEHDSNSDAFCANMEAVLMQVLYGGRDLATHVLKDIRQIGPLREIPAKEINADSVMSTSWMNGSHAWKLLADPAENESYEEDGKAPPSDTALIDAVGSALETLKTGFSLHLLKTACVDISSSDRFREQLECAINKAESDDPEDIALSIENLLSASPQKRNVLLRDTIQNIVFHPQDAAMGIVQLVPVIVAMLVDGTNVCSIEQPELHLHPAVQCELGSFLAECVSKENSRLALIETHSEHMLLRLQRLIRDKKLSSNDFSVVYFSRSAEGSLVFNLRLDENGEFIDEWPGGFFEESFNEMFGGT